MTGTSNSAPEDAFGRALRWAPLVLAGAAWVLRVVPLVGRGAAWGYAVDYDEGVYFSGASLLWSGALPWRDFVFVHPPGILLWNALPAALGTWLGPHDAFIAARWVSTLAGAVSVWLAGTLAARRAGPWAGVGASLALALYPELLAVERGVFLEPVLNLACLAMAWSLDRAVDADGGRRLRWLRAAGLLAGAAVAVKLWAGLWLLGALWAARRALGPDAPGTLLRWSLGAFCALVLPFALQAPPDFYDQVVRFHALRPPDGIAGRLDRLRGIFHWRHVAVSVLAAWGLWAGLRRRERWAHPGLFAVVWPGTLAAFLAATAYWEQYNAHLAASEAVLAGLGAAELAALSRRALPRLAWAPAVALAAALALPAWHARRTFGRDLSLPTLRREVGPALADVPCVLSTEPGWTLALDRLPPRSGAGPVLVDTYAAGLLAALKERRDWPSAQAALQSVSGMRPFWEIAATCGALILGWRGDFQLSDEARAQIRRDFHPAPRPDPAAQPDVWLRHAAPAQPQRVQVPP